MKRSDILPAIIATLCVLLLFVGFAALGGVGPFDQFDANTNPRVCLGVYTDYPTDHGCYWHGWDPDGSRSTHIPAKFR